jgi:hypothetical protein
MGRGTARWEGRERGKDGAAMQVQELGVELCALDELVGLASGVVRRTSALF